MSAPTPPAPASATSTTSWDKPLRWYYFYDPVCLLRGKEVYVDVNGKSINFVDDVLLAMSDAAFRAMLQANGTAAEQHPLIEAIRRFLDRPEVQAKREHAFEWDQPWPSAVRASILRMPDTFTAPNSPVTYGVPPEELILGPDRLVLPWPFPAHAQEQRDALAAKAGPVSVQKATFDPDHEIWGVATWDAIDHLLECDEFFSDHPHPKQRIVDAARDLGYRHVHFSTALPSPTRRPSDPTTESTLQAVSGHLQYALGLMPEQSGPGAVNMMIREFPCGAFDRTPRPCSQALLRAPAPPPA